MELHVKIIATISAVAMCPIGIWLNKKMWRMLTNFHRHYNPFIDAEFFNPLEKFMVSAGVFCFGIGGIIIIVSIWFFEWIQ